MKIHQQIHGYRSGHRLLAASMSLSAANQDAVDRLSDLSGFLEHNDRPPTYLTAYPLPDADFFALARTWYDDDAPRSGCVLTHTLLMSLVDWEAMASPYELLALLKKPRGQIERTLDQLDCSRVDISMPVPRPKLAGLSELVECLFLAQKQPVTFLGLEDAEVIALRVVQALWPSSRRNFSFCTFALQPRQIGERNFDLVFVPKESRSRFSSLDARRIDPERPRLDSHTWTDQLCRSIFEEPVPSLPISESPFPVDRGSLDHRSVRLALRWKELFDSSRHSPNAVLGMLDLLVAAGLSSAESSRRAEPVVLDALELVRASAPTEVSLKFLVALVSKLASGRPAARVVAGIRKTAGVLARALPNPALAALQDLQTRSFSVRAFENGCADALESHTEEDRLAYFRNAPKFAFARVLSRSNNLCHDLLAHAPAYEIEKLIGEVRELDVNVSNSLRPRVLRLSKPFDPKLAIELLRSIKVADVVRVVQQSRSLLGLNPTSEVSQAIVNRLASIDRDLTAVALADTIGKHLAAILIANDQTFDLEWVVENHLFADEELGQIVPGVLDRTGDSALRSLLGNRRIVDRLLPLLSGMEQANRRVRVLALCPPELTPATLTALCGGADQIETSEWGERLMEIWMPVTAADLPASSEAFEALLAAAKPFRNRDHATTTMRILFPDARSKITGTQRVEILRRLLHPDKPFAKELVVQSVVVAERLSRPTGVSMPEEGYALWGELLAKAARSQAHGVLFAAATSLHFSFEHSHLPVSKLVRAAFPVVFRALSSSSAVWEVESFFSFFDWDRQKALRTQLVKAFEHSQWPPGDLLLAAEEAGISDLVQKDLRRSKRGRALLRDAWKDLEGRRIGWNSDTSTDKHLEGGDDD